MTCCSSCLIGLIVDSQLESQVCRVGIEETITLDVKSDCLRWKVRAKSDGGELNYFYLVVDNFGC